MSIQNKMLVFFAFIGIKSYEKLIKDNMLQRVITRFFQNGLVSMSIAFDMNLPHDSLILSMDTLPWDFVATVESQERIITT